MINAFCSIQFCKKCVKNIIINLTLAKTKYASKFFYQPLIYTHISKLRHMAIIVPHWLHTYSLICLHKYCAYNLFSYTYASLHSENNTQIQIHCYTYKIPT